MDLLPTDVLRKIHMCADNAQTRTIGLKREFSTFWRNVMAKNFRNLFLEELKMAFPDSFVISESVTYMDLVIPVCPGVNMMVCPLSDVKNRPSIKSENFMKEGFLFPEYAPSHSIVSGDINIQLAFDLDSDFHLQFYIVQNGTVYGLPSVAGPAEVKEEKVVKVDNFESIAVEKEHVDGDC